MALQLIQIGFGLGIVAAYAALQFGRVGEHDLSYLVTNLVCAGGLTATAVVTVQPGFVISGGFWTLVSAVGLFAVVRRRRESRRASAASGTARARRSACPSQASIVRSA